MASKITNLLLITLVISLGFGALLRFEMVCVPIYLHDLLVATILLINFKNLPQIFKSFKILRIFILGLFISTLSALYLYPVSSLMIPFLYGLRLLSYLSLFFLLKGDSSQIPSSAFIISCLNTIVIGLVQYLLLPDMRWAQYLGWDDHLNRLTLPHYDPTFTGVMLSLAMFSVIKTNIRFAPIFLLPILLTYARSVWLSLAITMLSMFKSLKSLLLFILIFTLAIIALPDRFGEGTNLLRIYSINSRIISDLEHLKRYGWSLVLGRGLNTLILEQTENIIPNHVTGPNNSYLYLLSTTGIIGLVGWVMFIKSLYRESNNKSMLIFFFIASLFNNVMFYPFALLWVLIIEGRTSHHNL